MAGGRFLVLDILRLFDYVGNSIHSCFVEIEWQRTLNNGKTKS